VATRRLTIAAAAATIAMGALPASGAVVAPSVKVNGRSGYSQCRTPADARDVVYTQAETETRVATSPADANDLIGVWQQDQWRTGGARGLTSAWSDDGGQTWRGRKLPFGACGGSLTAFHRVMQPWVSFGPDGTAYVSAAGISSSGMTGVMAAVSNDGGNSWVRPRVVHSDPGTSPTFNEKPTVTADPSIAGTAYMVWSRFQLLATTDIKVPVMFSKTTDGGNTWSAPKAIAANATNRLGYGAAIVADPNTNTLYAFYTYADGPSTGLELRYVKSTNGGTRWSAPHVVNTLRSVGVQHPVTGEGLRTSEFLADVAIDPATGALYAAWQDARLNDYRRDEIVFSRSTDGGATWSRIVRVSSLVKRPAFTPTVAVSSDGTVGVSYYDVRFLKAGDRANLRTDYWLRTSTDGGRTFSGDKHVAGPFNMKSAPRVTGGYFIGEYMGLTTSGTNFVPFYVRTNCVVGVCTDRTDVFAAVVAP
jgi:hypothetical protein